MSRIDRVKARSAFLQRLALRTQIRSRLHLRSTMAEYRSVGLAIADELEQHGKRGSNIEISFDTTKSPPSFGDFFNVAMIARFLGATGLNVTFVIRDSGVRRFDWNDLNRELQDQHVNECEALAHSLIGNYAHVARSVWPLSPETIAPLEGHSIPAYLLTQTLFHTLLVERQWKLPNGFLLTQRDLPPVEPTPFRYLAWHVRRGIWEKARDTTVENLMNDFLALRALFPNHKIMLFSSQAGIEFALHHLQHSEGATHNLTPQPQQGFGKALAYALGSDFYFQRRGGGLSQIAVYSTLPYIILNDHASSYYFRSNDRLVPWAGPNQRFIVKRGVSALPIAGFV